MTNPFNKTTKSDDLLEIHQYTRDLERITLLRDKSTEMVEKAEYDLIIKIMQEVLTYLNQELLKK